MRILVATGNMDKLREIREILDDARIELVSMKEVGLSSDPEEDGSTFEENALIKAKALTAVIPGYYGPVACGNGNACPAGIGSESALQEYVSSSGLPVPKPKYDFHFDAVLSDDSGLVIDAMPEELGVHSARFMGHDTPYREKCDVILERLKDVPEDQRGARFVCAAAAAFPDGSSLLARGEMEGAVAHEYRGAGGFGYDPIFFLPEYGKTAAELTEEEKNAISHRGKALRQMREMLLLRLADGTKDGQNL